MYSKLVRLGRDVKVSARNDRWAVAVGSLKGGLIIAGEGTRAKEIKAEPSYIVDDVDSVDVYITPSGTVSAFAESGIYDYDDPGPSFPMLRIVLSDFSGKLIDSAEYELPSVLGRVLRVKILPSGQILVIGSDALGLAVPPEEPDTLLDFKHFSFSNYGFEAKGRPAVLIASKKRAEVFIPAVDSAPSMTPLVVRMTLLARSVVNIEKIEVPEISYVGGAFDACMLERDVRFAFSLGGKVALVTRTEVLVRDVLAFMPSVIPNAINDVKFSPDCRYLAVATSTGVVILETERLTPVYTILTPNPQSVDWDGKILAFVNSSSVSVYLQEA